MRSKDTDQDEENMMLLSGESNLEISLSKEKRIDTVPIMDPDAVDFSPVFVGLSGNGVNYHSQEDSFQKKKEEEEQYAFTPISSLRERFWFPYEFLRLTLRDLMHAYIPYRYLNNLDSVPKRKSVLFQGDNCTENGNHSNHKEEEPDFMKYVVFGMGFFIFLVVLTNSMDSTQYATAIMTQGATEKKSKGTAFDKDVKHAPHGTRIPPEIDHAYADFDKLPTGIMDTPIFWHIPRSAGTTMKLVLSMCMGRVVASEQGEGHQLDDQLEIINKPYGNFINVDTTTPLGLQRANELGLVPSRMVDVIATPRLYDATKIFDDHHQGRLFTVVRNPIDRVTSLYYFLRMPDQTAAYALGVDKMTLEEFAGTFSENWMVRTLTNTMTGPINAHNLDVAKEILRRKFLIGLLEDKTETLRRIEIFFGWKLPSRVAQTCKNNMMYFEPQSQNPHDSVDPKSRTYQLLENRNKMDFELFEYSKLLFQEQAAVVQKFDK